MPHLLSFSLLASYGTCTSPPTTSDQKGKFSVKMAPITFPLQASFLLYWMPYPGATALLWSSYFTHFLYCTIMCVEVLNHRTVDNGPSLLMVGAIIRLSLCLCSTWNSKRGSYIPLSRMDFGLCSPQNRWGQKMELHREGADGPMSGSPVNEDKDEDETKPESNKESHKSMPLGSELVQH